MLRQRKGHDVNKFNEYFPYSGEEGDGFIIKYDICIIIAILLDDEIYITDDYGGWVDTNLNYYNADAEPSGYFDNDFNFYNMKGIRIPGGYKGGKLVENRISEIKRYIEKVQNNDRAKFGIIYNNNYSKVIEFSNLPPNTKADHLL